MIRLQEVIDDSINIIGAQFSDLSSQESSPDYKQLENVRKLLDMAVTNLQNHPAFCFPGYQLLGRKRLRCFSHQPRLSAVSTKLMAGFALLVEFADCYPSRIVLDCFSGELETLLA